MERTLIFGGSGLLGSNYIFFYNKKKILNFFNKSKALSVKNFNFCLSKLDQFIIDNKIKVIINFAGISDVEKSERKKKLTYNTNVKLPEKLAEVCKVSKIKFIHISTDHFDSNNYPIKETSKIKTCNYYSYTKFLSEKKVLKKNKNALVIRTNFFGSFTKNKSFLEKILDSLSKKKKIYLWDDTFFNPVSIKFLLKVISNLIKKNAKGIFNVSSDNCISKYTFGLLVAKKYRFLNKTIIKSCKKNRDDLVKRPNLMYLDNKKVKKLLKIKNISINNLL